MERPIQPAQYPHWTKCGIPEAEIQAAADALKICWEGEENQRHLKETGFGMSYMAQAAAALMAAQAVRGKPVSEPPENVQ